MNHSRAITKAMPLLIGTGFFLSACTGDFAPTYPDSWLDFEDTAACIPEEYCHLEPSIFAGELAGAIGIGSHPALNGFYAVAAVHHVPNDAHTRFRAYL
jgi:hypothetical protein